MSLTTTIASVAATNPQVALAVNDQSTKSAMLYSLQSGDTSAASLLGALYNQQSESETLLNSVSHPYLGTRLDLQA